MKIKLLIIQNNAILGQNRKNIENIANMLRPYEGEHFDLILLPEVWNIGWFPKVFFEGSETLENSISLKFLRTLAIKFKANVIGGSIVRKMSDNTLRNSMPVFDRSGNLLAMYNKMHLFSNCGCNESTYVKNGEQPLIINLDIGRIGVSICYDIRFPEIYRAYGKAGVDILVNCAAWPKSRPHHWDTLTRARAIENQAFMIAVSQAGIIENNEYNLGYSQVISPFGDIISKMGNEVGTMVCEIETSETKKLRANFPVLKDIHRLEDYVVLEV